MSCQFSPENEKVHKRKYFKRVNNVPLKCHTGLQYKSYTETAQTPLKPPPGGLTDVKGPHHGMLGDLGPHWQ